MRAPTVNVCGWLNPYTGQKTRRDIHSIRLWRYSNPKFLPEPLFFAGQGIDTKEQALVVGYEMMTAQLQRRLAEEELDEVQQDVTDTR